NLIKMSKSLGNFFSLTDIFGKYLPAIVRYMLISVHYRSPLEFSEEMLDQSRQSFVGLRNSLFNASRVLQKQTQGVDASGEPRPELAEQADALSVEFLKALSD